MQGIMNADMYNKIKQINIQTEISFLTLPIRKGEMGRIDHNADDSKLIDNFKKNNNFCCRYIT